MSGARERIAWAADVPLDEALRLWPLLSPSVGVVKIGLSLFVEHGPAAVRPFRSQGEAVFLDLKLHDIPNTVENAAAAAGALGIAFLTVHASGGEEMMRATAEVIRNLFLAHRSARLVLRSGPGGQRRLVSANGYYLGLPTHLWNLPLPLMQWVDWRASSEKGWSEEYWALVEGRIVLRPGRRRPVADVRDRVAQPGDRRGVRRGGAGADRVVALLRPVPAPPQRHRFHRVPVPRRPRAQLRLHRGCRTLA